ncbi:PAC2 family protein [Candidatus Woesearchaeota archaeon]|nr:PAC2 family protein [Candidatus Woesearchaeota archaeon]
MSFKIKSYEKPKLKNPILIEGLPGMGNVGKIAVDFMIEHMQAKKFIEISSHNFPNSVFVNEKNLIELPKIAMYYKNTKDNSIMFLAGDVQPTDEKSCYAFCEEILDVVEKYKAIEVITLGGIGLPENPKKPAVYKTGNDRKLIDKYKAKQVSTSLYGFVGPIIGVSGVLLGLSAERKIPAISFLAETFGHPNHLGVKGAREILDVLNKNLNLKLNLKELDVEILGIEDDAELEKDFLKKIKQFPLQRKDTTYIG